MSRTCYCGSGTNPSSPRLGYKVRFQFSHHHIVEGKEELLCECNEPGKEPFEHYPSIEFGKAPERYPLHHEAAGDRRMYYENNCASPNEKRFENINYMPTASSRTKSEPR